ncbi:MAG: hypothetical protein QG604_389 [Candidatus Dependentiae bacterium]|nr:hypothetical protein [Candidatus Dependentiae bacterium]
MRKAINFTVLFTGVVLLTGCGYHRPQAVLTPPTEGQDQTIKDVLVRIKPLRDFECSYYFDNRLVSRGIQPIQLFVQNDTDRYYVLDGKDITLDMLGKRDVGAVLYKNVIGRSIVWLTGTIAFFWKLFLPILIIDTLFCLQANKEISNDIASICINPKQKLVIAPRSRMHKVLFVPTDSYYHHVTIVLKEQDKEDAELTFRF